MFRARGHIHQKRIFHSRLLVRATGPFLRGELEPEIGTIWAAAGVNGPVRRAQGVGLLRDGEVAVGVADDNVPAVLGKLLAGQDGQAAFVFHVVTALFGEVDGGGVVDFLAGNANRVIVVLLLYVLGVSNIEKK